MTPEQIADHFCICDVGLFAGRHEHTRGCDIHRDRIAEAIIDARRAVLERCLEAVRIVRDDALVSHSGLDERFQNNQFLHEASAANRILAAIRAINPETDDDDAG